MNAFLSIASKAAALALLIRVAVGFTAVPDGTTAAELASFRNAEKLSAPAAESQFRLTAVDVGDAAGRAHPSTAADGGDPLAPVRKYAAYLVATLAAITCTFGNLAAYGQSNIKRLFAYSTIAHAGYMMMPVAAGIALIGSDADGAAKAFAAVGFYLVVYLFMNLGAFAVIAFLRNAMGSEQISDYAGLIRHCPGVSVCLSLILFSLVGLPPLAGFVTKFAAFAALADAKMWALLAVGCLNTALSLFYYLRVIKVMTFDPDPDDRPPVSMPLASPEGIFVFALTIPVAVLVVQWSNLFQIAWDAARPLVSVS